MQYDDVDRELDNKKNILDTIYIAFFLRNCYGSLKVITCSYNCRE